MQIMESYSQLARTKIALGINRTTATSSSSYILTERLKRALEGITADQHKQFIKAHDGPKKRELMINQYINKIYSLDQNVIRYMWDVLDNDGITAFLLLFRVPAKRLRKDASRSA